MNRNNYFRFSNGNKAKLPFSDNEYENRLKGLKKIITEKSDTANFNIPGHREIDYFFNFF